MIRVSTVYLNEIEDRFSALFYQERYLKPVREFKKAGFTIRNLGDLIRSATNGVEIRKYVKRGTPYIRVSDMKSIFVSLSAVKHVTQTLKDVTKKIKLTAHSILISRSGTPGITSMVTKDLMKTIISSHVIKVEVNKGKIDPRFFGYLS